jgi:hypothetical protein
MSSHFRKNFLRNQIQKICRSSLRDKEIIDLEECRNYANERMEKLKDGFEAILKK